MLPEFLKRVVLEDVVSEKPVRLQFNDVDKDEFENFIKEKYPEKYEKLKEYIDKGIVKIENNKIKAIVLKDVKVKDALEFSKRTNRIDFLQDIPKNLTEEERKVFSEKIIPKTFEGGFLKRAVVSGLEGLGKGIEYIKEKDISLYEKFPKLKPILQPTAEKLAQKIEDVTGVEKIESAWGKLGKPLEKIGGSPEVFKYFNPITPEIRGITEFIRNPSVLTGIGAFLSGFGLKQVGKAAIADASKLAEKSLEAISETAKITPQVEMLKFKMTPLVDKSELNVLKNAENIAEKVFGGKDDLGKIRQVRLKAYEQAKQPEILNKLSEKAKQELTFKDIVPKPKLLSEEYVKHPEKFVDELVAESEKNIKNSKFEIKTEQAGEKIKGSLKENLYEFLVEQNLKILKYPPLYKFYSALSASKWETARYIKSVIDMFNELPKPIKIYANNRIYLKSILEDLANGIDRGVSVQKLDEALRKLEKGLLDIGLTPKQIEMYNRKVDQIAQKMSDVGINILKNSNFISPEVFEILKKKKYYFPYFKPELLQNIETGIKTNIFKDDALVEGLTTGFLQRRLGGSILPEPNVIENFIKGTYIKVYTKNKYKAIKDFIDNYAIEIDDNIIALTPEKAKNLAKALNVSEDAIGLVHTNPEKLGFVKIDLPIMSEQGKIFKKYLVPKEVADYLLDRHNSLTMSTIEKSLWNYTHLINAVAKDQMLSLNPRYFSRMIFRDLFTGTLSSLGDLTKTTGNLYRFISKVLNIKQKGDIADSVLRPLFDFDSLIALAKLKYKELKSLKKSAITQALGEEGFFSGLSHFPQLKEKGIDFKKLPQENIFDTIKRNLTKETIKEVPYQVYNEAVYIGNNITAFWDEVYKTLTQGFRLVPKEIKLSELVDKLDKMPPIGAYNFVRKNIIPKILENQAKLEELALSQFSRDARSMLKGVSIDFERFGAIVPKINYLFYFLNPRIQSLDYFMNFIKTNPHTFALRLATFVSALSSYYYMLFKIDEENKKKYGDRYISMIYSNPQYFSNNLPIYLGTAEFKNGVVTPIFFTAPYGEYLSSVTIPVYLSMFYNYFGKNFDEKAKNILEEDYKKSMASSYVRNLIPDLSAVVSLPLGLMLNERLIGSGFGTEIVPKNLQDLENFAQYRDERGNVYRVLGRAFNVSPEEIEYIISALPLFSDIVQSKLSEDVARSILKKMKVPYKQESPTDYLGGLKDIAPLYYLKPEFIEYTQERLVRGSKKTVKDIKTLESDVKNAYENLIKTIIFNPNDKKEIETTYDIFFTNFENLINYAIENEKVEELSSLPQKLKNIEDEIKKKYSGESKLQQIPKYVLPNLTDFIINSSLQRAEARKFTQK